MRKGRTTIHPHADASYRVYHLEDGAFGVEVAIPAVCPTKITRFPTRAAANKWIADHKETVEKQSVGGRFVTVATSKAAQH